MLPSETVGIWSLFMTITAFSTLLDFGFNSSFTRNITYIFSGVKSLKKEGVEIVSKEDPTVDWVLLKGIISAMRWFYSRVALLLFVLLASIGTGYIHVLLKNYEGNRQQVYIAWVLLCLISTYNLYTQYYDSLLQGRGLIKRSKQIVIAGQSLYLLIASLLILKGFGLIAIVSAQASSVLLIRWLSFRSFFTREINGKLEGSSTHQKRELLSAIAPNAVKMGLTALGAFMALRSAIVIGSLYLPLKEIASYGITMQLIGIISGLAGIYAATYQPKIAQLRVEQDIRAIKRLYLRGLAALLLSYLCGGICLLALGKWGLTLIGSKTQLIPNIMVMTALIISFLENNQGIAGGILLSNNEVPFFRASLIAGILSILLVWVMFQFTGAGIWAMILAPGIAHLYNNWKWPYEVIRQLDITMNDLTQQTP